MKLENFLEGIMNRGELTSILGQSIVDMMDEMGYDIENLDYRHLFTFINQENAQNPDEKRHLLEWIDDNLEEGLIANEFYEEYLKWVSDMGGIILSKIEFGKLVNRETEFRTVPKYVSAYGKTMRVYELKD